MRIPNWFKGIQRENEVVNFLKRKGLDYWKSPIPSGMYGVIMREIALNKADFDYYIKHY